MGRPGPCGCCVGDLCPPLTVHEPLATADTRNAIVINRETARTADGFTAVEDAYNLTNAGYAPVTDHSVTLTEQTEQRTEELHNAFTTIAGSNLIEVTYRTSLIAPLTPHGLTVGDIVRFNPTVSVGGLTIAGNYAVQSIVDDYRFTITDQTASSSETSSGIVNAEFTMHFTQVDIQYTEPAAYYRYKVELKTGFNPYDTFAFKLGYAVSSKLKFSHAYTHGSLDAALAAGFSRPESDLTTFATLAAPVETTDGSIGADYYYQTEDCWTVAEWEMAANPVECSTTTPPRTLPNNHGPIDPGTYSQSLFWAFGQDFRIGEDPPAGGTVRRYSFRLAQFSSELLHGDMIYHNISGNFPTKPLPSPSLSNPSGATQQEIDQFNLSGHVRAWLETADTFTADFTVTSPDLPASLNMPAGTYVASLAHTITPRDGRVPVACKIANGEIYAWECTFTLAAGFTAHFMLQIFTTGSEVNPSPVLPILSYPVGIYHDLTLLDDDGEIAFDPIGLSVTGSTTPFALAEDGFLSGANLSADMTVASPVTLSPTTGGTIGTLRITQD